MIEKIGPRKYKLVSKKSHKNLGTASSLAASKQREREVEYFKHRAFMKKGK